MTRNTNPPEIELPFIAEIVMSVFTLAVSWLYFRSWFLVFAALLLLILLAFRRQAWSISAAVLMTLAFDLFQRGRAAELRVVMFMLAAGVVLQLLAALWQRYQIGYWGSSYRENAAFAVLGLVIAYAIQFRLCPPVVTEINLSAVVYLWLGMAGCMTGVAMEPLLTLTYGPDGLPIAFELKPGMETFSPLFFTTLALVFLRAFLLSPVFWAVFMAGLRAAGLAIWNPLRVLRAFWRALWGAQWAGLAALVLIGFLFLVREALRPTGIEIPPEPLLVIFLAINLTALITGAASGASRFE